MQGKTIIILMDGTWNEPEYQGENGRYPQGDATNVEKIKKLLEEEEKQPIHYIRGIGTDGKVFKRVTDGAFGTSAEQRVDEAIQAIETHYESGDEIVLFGFSRGAATPRILANRIQQNGINGKQPPIRFMGLWDTVASLGVPVPKLDEFRKKFHDAQERLKIPENVKQVVHLVAIDENRSLFEPTLVSTASSAATSVDETWFAGNHGDVGGGWEKRHQDEKQLSDVTLAYMIRKAEANGVKFIQDWQARVNEPKNGEGLVHELTLKDATLLVGGKLERTLRSAGSVQPRVHSSVKKKYDNDTTYRPAQISDDFAGVKIVTD